MSLINLDHTCNEVDLPLCRIIKKDFCKYITRKGTIMIMEIDSPSTVILLSVALLCTFRLLVNTSKHYAAIGRKELILFFYMYIGCLATEILLVSGITANEYADLYLTTIQLSLASTSLFSLFIGGIASATLPNIGFFKSIVIVRVLSFAHFLVFGVLVLTGLLSKNGAMLFFLLFVTNLSVAVFYVISQLVLLVKNDSEIWAYGTLSIAVIFFALASVSLFYGAELIALLSERYLDSLFFFHLFMFCTIIMVHKYWLSICDFEAECAALVQENDDL